MIDLRSDTVTNPTSEMREAMLTSFVGDDVYEEDPTVNELEKIAAGLLGKEDALFVTSGTQGNQVAVLTHTRPGEEIILEANSHVFYYESGAVATLAGVQTKVIDGKRGQMNIKKIKKSIRDKDIHFPKTSLIILENTHNRAGGAVLPLDYMKEVLQVSKDYGIPIHLDGARLFNAATNLGVEVKEIAQYVDTVQICLTKGLSAPIGSILAGPASWIEKARIWRKRLGGGMRQVGVVAGPGIISLTKMISRLQEDHYHAKRLAEGLNKVAGINVDLENVDTNIVLVDIEALDISVDQFIHLLREKGVLCTAFDTHLIRLVTHRHINEKDIDETIFLFSNVASKC